MPSNDPIQLTIGHSPDPDDAFMWWPLGDVSKGIDPTIDTGRFRFRPVADDIEQLNRRAIETGDLDLTACSMHTYAHVAQRYVLTACGASMGDGYGPKIVSREAHPAGWLETPGITVAVPGLKTTACLALQLMAGTRMELVPAPFETIVAMAASGEVDAGVVIHEAQLTFRDQGLHLVADLGVWWKAQTGLPLPLGANVARRDLDDRFGPGTLSEVEAILRGSIEAALADRAHGVKYALGFAQPGTGRERADEFIGLYVNDLTIDAGEGGRRAVEELLRRGADAGLSPDPGAVEMVGGR